MIYSLLANDSRTVLTFLSDPIIIVGMSVLVLGIVITLLARTIALRSDKSVNSVTYKESKVYRGVFLGGCITMVIGLLLVIVGTSILVCQF